MTPNPEPREERVAALDEALRIARGWLDDNTLDYREDPYCIVARATLTTVEALAGLQHGDGTCPGCAESPPYPHEYDCTVGIASEAWRRFTQKGEHDD